MARLSDDLKNYLSQFFIAELAGSNLDGITYTMLFKDSKNITENTKYKNYMTIRNEANACGYPSDEVFRVYEVSNGYIFDMDSGVASKILGEVLKGIVSEGMATQEDIKEVKNLVMARRKRDMNYLASFVVKEYGYGREYTEVALFNKNATSRIMVTGELPTKEKICIAYNAYALRHTDISEINAKILIPKGYRISNIRFGEVLPLKNGVSFILKTEKLK